jgi:sugar-specific transcriptional regulator TrmB
MEQIPRTVKNFLEELGCNKTEITIINQLLKVSGLTLRELCRVTEKSTGVLSEALKKLIGKGIVKRERVNGSPTYAIENPDTIFRWVDRESDRNISALKQKKQDFERFSKTLVANSVKPKVRFFTGMEGLRESYYEILKYKPKMLMSYLSMTGAYQKEILDLLDGFVKKRIEENIAVKIIARKSPMTVYLKLRDKQELRSMRIVTQNLFPMANSEVNLYGNCMHSMSVDPNGVFAFIVEDRHMVSIHKAAFELAWKEAEGENLALEKEIAKIKDPRKVIKEIEEAGKFPKNLEKNLAHNTGLPKAVLMDGE